MILLKLHLLLERSRYYIIWLVVILLYLPYSLLSFTEILLWLNLT